MTLISFDGSASYRVGAQAEEWTSAELRQLPAPWRVEDHIPFGNRFDVDHVAVGPHGVLAVETVWTSGHWNAAAAKPDRFLVAKIDQTRRNARTIRSLMLTPVGRPPVIPLLVCWGPHVAKIACGAIWINDVLVTVGAQADEWLPTFNDDTLNEATIDRAWAVLQCHVELTERSPNL
jgi:hypothetical protein